MENSKPLYQPWNDEEFWADPWVRQVMNRLQRMMYKNLLNQTFFCSTRPYLPDDDDELWLLADCESKEEWLDNKEVVLKRFHSENGRLANKRVLDDWARVVEKRAELHEKRAVAGRRGGIASAKQRQANARDASSKPSNPSIVSEVREESKGSKSIGVEDDFLEA
jgi:uncharacterized protein YdaU (DUF1376 family)